MNETPPSKILSLVLLRYINRRPSGNVVFLFVSDSIIEHSYL
jgi:hypothetical protein